MPVIGVVENMKIRKDVFVSRNVADAGFSFLGDLPFDPKVEESIGNVNLLLETDFAKKLAEIVLKLSSSLFGCFLAGFALFRLKPVLLIVKPLLSSLPFAIRSCTSFCPLNSLFGSYSIND